MKLILKRLRALAKHNDDGYRVSVTPAEARAVAFLIDAALEALEFVEAQEDVVDGDYGEPKPNRAMRVASALREALGEARL